MKYAKQPFRTGMGIVLASLTMAQAAAAQTTVGGIINTDTTWDASGSPYMVTETIRVAGGATLTILANVDIRFDSGAGMVIGPLTLAGSGTLRALGADRAQVFFDGGDGLVFGPNAVPATFDPGTGAFIDGSTLQWTSIGNTRPPAGVGGPYAMRIASKVPYLDNVRFFTLAPGAGAIHADLGSDPTVSLKWGTLRLSNIVGPGLRYLGGSEHVIRSFTATNVSKTSGSTHLIEGFVRAMPEGSWDLDIRGGRIENCSADRLFDLDRDSRVRVENVTFQDCPGVAVGGTNLGRLELISCRFINNGINVSASAIEALVRDCQFIGTRRPSGVTIDGRGLQIIEDCLFEDNAGPALVTLFPRTIVRRCRFVGNVSVGSAGAVLAGSSTDLVDNHFERNSAQTGGAVQGLGFFSRGNTYIGNTAVNGGAIAAGRVAYVGFPGSPDVFTGNSAIEDGGAVYVLGSGVDLTACRFERNTAARGGAIAVGAMGTDLSISVPGGNDTTMRGNTAVLGQDIYVAAPATSAIIQALCVDWGTTDRDAIADRIFDGDDDPTLATISFDPIGPCGCRVDLDGDGELTIFDFLAFQTAFDAGDLETADFDGDGELTIFDFLAFQTEFNAGCH